MSPHLIGHQKVPPAGARRLYTAPHGSAGVGCLTVDLYINSNLSVRRAVSLGIGQLWSANLEDGSLLCCLDLNL